MNQLLKLIVAASILSLGFFAQSCSSSKTLEVKDLSGYWTLKSLKGEAANEAFTGSIPSLEFNLEENQVFGSGGCNRYSGGFTLEGTTFKATKLASTMRLCMEANKEDLFINTLSTEEGLQASIEKDVLTFKADNKVVLEFKKGEAPKAASRPATAGDLVGSWKLTTMVGETATSTFQEDAPTLVYAEGGAVSGNAGCNSYRTNATWEESTISFGPMMSTKMACPHLDVEQAFSTLLSKPMVASISGDKLLLSQDGKVVLEFLKDLD